MASGLNVIILLSLGFILLLIELLTPGFSVTGIAGLLLLTAGCFLSYKLSAAWGIAATAATLLMVAGFFKLFTKSPLWKKMRLDTSETKNQGFCSFSDLNALVDKEGKTISALRPTGAALIQGKRYDVTAESLFIDKDKPIKILRVEGNKIIVSESA